MDVRINIDYNRVTIDDLIMLDELQVGNVTAKQLKSFVSRFIVDDTGNPIPEGEAFATAGKMTMEELKRAFEGINGAVKELHATAIPPAMSSG